MNIDKTNFFTKLKELKKLISDADFIAFDCEFTGLFLKSDNERSKYDSLEDIYQKSKHVCQNFSINQIGLSIYIWNSENNKYIAYPFNFSLNKNSIYEKTSHLYQADCMNFLSQNHFDFKNQFLNGLNYEKLSEKKLISNFLKNDKEIKFKIFECSKTKQIKNQIKTQIENFLSNPKIKKIDIDCESIYLAKKLQRENEIDELMNKETNLSVQSIKNQSKIIELKRKRKKQENADKINANEEIKDEKNENILKLEEKIDLEMGFSLLIEEIIKNKKIIVGHYAILDLMYMYNSFVNDLPDNFILFKKEILNSFPFIYDTKLIAITSQKYIRIHHSLEPLYLEVLTKKYFENTLNVELVNDINFEKYKEQKLPHEAGFDSFMTGNVFIALLNFNKIQENKDKLFSHGKIEFLQYKEFLNSLYHNLHCSINLDKNEDIINIENNFKYMNTVIYFERFDKKIDFNEIGLLFNDINSDINLDFLYENSGFIELINYYFEPSESELNNIIDKVSKKYNDKIKFVPYFHRKRFKAYKIKF